MHNIMKSLRFYSSSTNKQKVCVVGAGPAGFYAAMHLVKNAPYTQIDLLEKLPVPFGLIRYGVAPDHPEVKNVINQFTKVALNKNVNFYGNIALGKDVKLKQLQENYDAVLLTYGADQDKGLGIENEDADNVIAARRFVGWYNGLPTEKYLQVDLSGETAVILGQGNVGLDVARVLLSPIDVLRKTDITEHALAALAQSKVRQVYLIGRRGPLQVAFTIKELREQLKMPNCQTVWREKDFENVPEDCSTLPRPRRRLTELMLKSLKESSEPVSNDKKVFRPIFFRSPKKFLVNGNKLSGINMICNKLEGDSIESMKCVSTDKTEEISCTLALRSIGYKSVNVDQSICIGPNGAVVNDNGKVLDSFGNLYVAGWLGTGPEGVILHTMGNAFHVAKTINEDLNQTSNNSNKPGFEGIKTIIMSNNTQIVDWSGWEKIDKYEVEQGQKVGKPREKVCDLDKMLEIASS